MFLLSVLLHVYNSCYALIGICLQGGVWANVPALLNKGIRADRLIITSLGHTGYILLQYPFAKHMSWRLLLQYIITVMLQDLLATSKTQTRQWLQNVLIRRLQWPICPLSLVPNHLYWSLPTDFKQPLLTVYSFLFFVLACFGLLLKGTICNVTVLTNPKLTFCPQFSTLLKNIKQIFFKEKKDGDFGTDS